MTRMRRRTAVISTLAICLALAAGAGGAVLLLRPADDATPWIALLPESERKLNCVINIIDYRAID